MTICVAAICNDGRSLVGASDRMITAGTQYISPEPKVFTITPSIVAMWAGEDVDFIHGILTELRTDIAARMAENPAELLGVKEAAEGLLQCFNRARNRLMSQDLLARFDMTPATFPKSGWEKHPGLVDKVADRMAAYQTPETEILIVGVDRSGAHLYQFENVITGGGNIHLYDGAGFRAIGAGHWHAHSQLELASYGPSRSEAEALFLVYLAKKRADVVAGISERTDVFLFTPHEGELPQYHPLDTESKQRLHKIYKALKKSEERANAAAIKATTEWRGTFRLVAGTGQFTVTATLAGLGVAAQVHVEPPPEGGGPSGK